MCKLTLEISTPTHTETIKLPLIENQLSILKDEDIQSTDILKIYISA